MHNIYKIIDRKELKIIDRCIENNDGKELNNRIKNASEGIKNK